MTGRLRISRSALRHNASALARLLAPSGAAFVVKSNAYGHGLTATARAIEPLADRLCVYEIGEAVALRDAGIGKPILVLGPIAPEALGDAHGANAEIALWGNRDFMQRSATVGRARGRPFGAHLKINTGLNRLGVEPAHASAAVEHILGEPEGLALTGMFSHLAAAEEIDSPYTAHQLDAFEAACATCEPLMNARGVRPLRHIAASASAMLWPQTRLDFARCGIALYGLWPSPQTREAVNAHGLDLHPALEYNSHVAATRDVAAGSAIGYGNTFHAPRDMRVGVVPCGYADGVPRAMSNRGAFVVAGVRCPIVGRVAMNTTVVDLTAAPRAGGGSVVTLLGSDGDASVTADEWAEWCDTINYEIVARLPPGIPRDYVD